MAEYELPEDKLREIAKRTNAQMQHGKTLLKQSSDEAIDYIGGIIDGDVDKNAALERNGVMLGVVEGLTDHVIPNIYEDMQKSWQKRPMKMPKELAQAISNIFLARLLNNLVARLEDERK